MTVLRQTTTKKGKTRYWVDFVSDRRHQRKFQIFEDACEYLYLNWFCYNINNRSVNDDAVFDSATLREMMQVYYGYQQHRYAHNEISYNTLNRYKSILAVDIDISMSSVTANMFVDINKGVKTCLKIFFQWLMSYDLIKINPIRTVKYIKKLPYIAKIDDINNLNSNNKLSSLDKLVVFIAQHTGARISEIVTLRMDNISDKTISFVTHDVGGKEVLQTKSGIGRTIRVNKMVIDQIKENYTPNPNSYVFWDVKKRVRLTKNAIVKRFERNASFAKWHSFRHRAASEWIHKGVDLTTISKVLGHSSVEYTMRQYAHLIHANDEMPTL